MARFSVSFAALENPCLVADEVGSQVRHYSAFRSP